MKRLFLVLTILSFLGCAHVISQELRQSADKGITPAELFKNPEGHKGKIVILGGAIVHSLNTSEGTYIEVLQKPLDSRGRPENTDISHGRFLILYDGYLDPAIYSTGREITVAGEVMGKKIQALGEIQYSYTLIKTRELHLLEPSAGIPIIFGIEIWKSF
ncbi:MAG: Slp family lipoprotein [Nitrospirae bacterium]|nr:Slp family lipoprotein [Nitrospirota bacterium]